MPQTSRRERRAQRRGTKEAPAPPAPGRLWVWGLVVVALVAGGGGAWWWLSAAHPRAAAQQAGERIPDEGYEHVPVGTVVAYRAHPPASGPHYPAPAPAGVYVQGLEPGFWVHNLEHGYVVVLYKPPIAADLVTQFRAMLQEFPPSKFGNVKLVFAPYENMLHRFAVLSWDWRMWLDLFDRTKVLEFYRAHVDQGREDLP